MSWLDHVATPIHAAPLDGVARQYFHGKPYALAFLASGQLVIGGARGLALHDPEGDDAPELLDVGGAARWMLAHPDGVSVIVAASGPAGHAIVRAWPAQRRVTVLRRADSFGYSFSGALSPDGAQVYWLETGTPPTLHTLDATTGQELRALALPQEVNGNATFAADRDGAVYLKAKKLLIVHADGRQEERDDSPFFMAPNPLLITDAGHIVGVGAELIERSGAAFVHGDLRLRSNRFHDGTYSGDRARVIFYGSLAEASVVDVATMKEIFSVEHRRATGSIPGWRGQSASASATHVAAIDHGDASVLIWRLDDPKTVVRRIEGSSQGIRRMMFHGDAVTVHTCQPNNTLTSVLEIALESGATRQLDLCHIADVVRTHDAKHMLVLTDGGYSTTSKVLFLDDAGEPTPDLVEVQRSAERLALSPDDAVWGAISHTFSMRSDPTCHIQWRAFGATRWAKTLKLKGYWPQLALSNTAAVAIAGDELVAATSPKGKQLCALSLKHGAKGAGISPSGAWGAVASHNTLQVFDVAVGVLTDATVSLPVPSAPSAICIQDEEHFFAGHASGAITRHTRDGAQIGLYLGHTDEVCTLKWHDGRLWSGSEDGTMLEWSVG
jgi:hypothetical protein